MAGDDEPGSTVDHTPEADETLLLPPLPERMPPVGTVGSWHDDRDGYDYRIITIDGITWFGEDLRFVPHTTNQRPTVQPARPHPPLPAAGRLYSPVGAVQACPSGWRLPGWQDWLRLIEACGRDAFRALMPGGATGFDIQLAGYIRQFWRPDDSGVTHNYPGTIGFYLADLPTRGQTGRAIVFNTSVHQLYPARTLWNEAWYGDYHNNTLAAVRPILR